MIIVKIGNGKSFDSALKEFKNKISKTKLIKELLDNQYHTKKSVKRRHEVLKATWIEKNKKED